MAEITTNRGLVAFGGICTLDGNVSYWGTGPFVIPGGGGVEGPSIQKPLYIREVAFWLEDDLGNRFEARVDVPEDGIRHQSVTLD